MIGVVVLFFTIVPTVVSGYVLPGKTTVEISEGPYYVGDTVHVEMTADANPDYHPIDGQGHTGIITELELFVYYDGDEINEIHLSYPSAIHGQGLTYHATAQFVLPVETDQLTIRVMAYDWYHNDGGMPGSAGWDIIAVHPKVYGDENDQADDENENSHDDTPGFEAVTLIVALAIALIIIRKKT